MPKDGDDPVEAQALTLADINKIVDEIYKAEGAQAADAAFQRMAREYREAREAQGIIAPSAIDELELALGDLEAGTDKPSEVIECLDELDAPDTANGRARAAASATMLAVFQRIEARNTETHDTPAKAEASEAKGSIARTDLDDLDLALGDLEVGAGESAEEVIEHLDELDASAEDAIESAVAREEAYETQAVLDEARKTPITVMEQLRACRAKINGVEVAQGDPLATEKIKVTRYLKRYGRTPDALPDGFWNEPEEVRGILLGQVVGPVMAERRFAKRVKRSIDRGYPADYYSRPSDERKKISNVVRKRRSRAKRATMPAPTPKAPLPTVVMTKEWMSDSLKRLKSWTASCDPMAIQLRGRERDFVKARITYHGLSNMLGRAPTQSEIAAKLGCTRPVAQNRIKQLRRLEGVGGPWREKCDPG